MAGKLPSSFGLQEIEQCPERLREKLVAEIQRIPVLVISEDENSAELLEIQSSAAPTAKAGSTPVANMSATPR